MKVLFACRPQIFDVPGGDTVQLLKMQKYLDSCGIEATISPNPADILKGGFDLVHVFNLFDIESMHEQTGRAKKLGIPFVITTNYWNPIEFFFETSHSLLHRMARSLLPRSSVFNYYAGHKRKRMSKDIALQREALDNAERILPNSEEEALELQRDFAQPKDKFSIIYNAVDFEDIEPADANLFADRYGLRDFVLCVGRFEERKNQLGVAKALAGLSTPVVFIGGVPSYQRSYFDACRRAADKIPRSLFIEGLPQQEVFSAMKAAKVHVLGSWWENTGLVSLEASICGCNVVTTNRAPWREYFDADAWICDPADPTSLRSAVDAALSAPYNQSLAERIRERFTWPLAADSLKKAYESVLKETLR
ncbi:MAG TPA: glycosyltransferase family 4 protein [Negativicutes bacterium]|nr:glycosyltransferase family 4 protein [Negativicutes bacterium]